MQYTLIVYPTAIFIEHKDLISAYKFMKENKKCTVYFGAAEYSHPIQRAFLLDKNKKIKMINPNLYKTRTQDLEKFYYDAGQFYFCQSTVIRKSMPFFNKDSSFLILPRTKAIDIDHMGDVKLAEIIMRNINEKKKNI